MRLQAADAIGQMEGGPLPTTLGDTVAAARLLALGRVTVPNP